MDANAEQEIFRLVNTERKSRGLATLILDERLQQAARAHSQRMAVANGISHQFPGEPKLVLRLGALSLRFDSSGENVALDYNSIHAHESLMSSPGHRANILAPQYNALGIGVVRTDAGIFVTQDFARRFPEVSVEEVESQVALQLNRVRRAAELPLLNRVPVPELRSQACQMAANDKLDARAVLSSPKAKSAVTFTAIDLNQISDSLKRIPPDSGKSFSVGACYRSSASYDNPLFWVIVVTYR